MLVWGVRLIAPIAMLSLGTELERGRGTSWLRTRGKPLSGATQRGVEPRH